MRGTGNPNEFEFPDSSGPIAAMSRNIGHMDGGYRLRLRANWPGPFRKLARTSPVTLLSGRRAIWACVIAFVIVAFARLITGVRADWRVTRAFPRRRVYFANHTSMGDFVLLWAVLPARVRRTTRPVAGSDYWLASKLKEFIVRHVFNAVLIERNCNMRQADPVELMANALGEGGSLILFPEGTRNTTAAPTLPFKSGLYHLARNMPDVELVPVWIDNLRRVLPKGEVIPIPIACTVTFGAPIQIEMREDKGAFLERARSSLMALAPTNRGNR